MATTHILPADTLISTLTLASGDTINLDGHGLIVDSDAVATAVTLANTGADAHLELRDGGRIKLNATLPANILPWVDPANPLPESNYTAGLTGNASAEIQIGAFSLGGGPARLPTATRAGGFWALVDSWPDSTHAVLDRDLPLHAGDLLVCLATYNSMAKNEVSGYDPATRTVQFATAPSRRTAGDLWALVAGGVFVNAANTAPAPLNAPVEAGTLNLVGNAAGALANGHTTSTIRADRLVASFTTQVGNLSSCLCGSDASVSAGQCVCNILHSNTAKGSTISIGEVAAQSFAHNMNQTAALPAKIRIGGGCICAADSYRGLFAPLGFGVTLSLNATRILNANLFTPDSRKRAIEFSGSCTVGGVVYSDMLLELADTATRAARSAFPTDTDLPDAYCFVPATPADVPWRFEDHWVRKGETLRLSVRAMLGGDASSARVAISRPADWAPETGSGCLAEWKLDSGAPLQWRGAALEWRNDTGEDCQVRVWSMASGLNGAYLRVWRATGGPM